MPISKGHLRHIWGIFLLFNLKVILAFLEAKVITSGGVLATFAVYEFWLANINKRICFCKFLVHDNSKLFEKLTIYI